MMKSGAAKRLRSFSPTTKLREPVPMVRFEVEEARNRRPSWRAAWAISLARFWASATVGEGGELAH
jgi:hypothetical protein